MVENFNDLLPVDHFFNDAFGFTDRLLLGHEEACRFSAKYLCQIHRNNGTPHNDQRHPDTVVDHDAEDSDNRNSRDEQLREGLRNHLPHRIHIVGIVRHHIAALMRIKVTDRQAFHVCKHLVAHLVQGTLCKDRHQLIVGKAGNKGNDIKTSQDQYIMHNLRLRLFPGHLCFPGFLNHSNHFLLKHCRNR